MSSNTDHKAVNNALFHKYAPIYDCLVLPLKFLRRRVVTLSGVSPGMRVLDVACGTGEQSIAFARSGASVFGLDLSPDMLAKAKKKMCGQSVNFLLGDATSLPFNDASFDITTISLALHDMPEEMGLAVLREMKRVGKPGGMLVIADYFPPKSLIARCIHMILSIFESRYYQHFLHRGIEWYASNEILPMKYQEVRLFGVVQIFVSRM